MKFQICTYNDNGKETIHTKTLDELLEIDEDWEEVLRCEQVLWRRQFSGLKDKNGVEIYEKDVVHFEYDDVDYFFLVSIDERGCFVAHNEMDTNDFYFLDDFDYLVIGNTYQNPDLLKQYV